MTNATTLDRPPIAVGPLIPLHRKSGASIEVQSGWEVAQSYPSQPSRSSNALIDLTGRFVTEISGPETDQWLKSYCNGDVAIRDVKSVSGCDVYRLTNVRAIVFSQSPIDSGVNVTGGWASIGLFGPEALSILQKMTAIDLRDSALGIGRCAQGPVFGVNTLFGRFKDHYELHACPDMTQFLWEVVLDAGQEFGLKPAGRKWLESNA